MIWYQSRTLIMKRLPYVLFTYQVAKDLIFKVEDVNRLGMCFEQLS